MKTENKLGKIVRGIVVFGLMANAQFLLADTFSIDWSKVSGGGGTSTGGVFQVTGTIGQADAGGTLTGGSFSLEGGFWSLISVIQTPGMPALAVSRIGNSITVSWAAMGIYTLEQSSDLGTTNWVGSPYVVTTANGTSSTTFTPVGGRWFFRLKQ